MSSLIFRSFSATVLVLCSLRATAVRPDDTELTADIAGDPAVPSSVYRNRQGTLCGGADIEAF